MPTRQTPLCPTSVPSVAPGGGVGVAPQSRPFVPSDLRQPAGPVGCAAPAQVPPSGTDAMGKAPTRSLGTAGPDHDAPQLRAPHQSSALVLHPDPQVQLGAGPSRPAGCLPDAPSIPALPTSGLRGPVRAILATVAPTLLQGTFAGVNRLFHMAEEAKGRQDFPLEHLNTVAATRLQLKLLEFTVGKTLHVNATVKNQTDLPRWDALPPETRAQLDAILSTTMAGGDVIDVEPTFGGE